MFEITIPVLNEEETLEENVLHALMYIEENVTKDFTLVIADNGSTDKTMEIGERLAKDKEKVFFVKVPKRGVGLALRTSWTQSNADYVGYMDLDLATDLKHLKEVFEILTKEDVEIVNGSRLLPGSKVENRTNLREVTSRGFNFLVQSLLGVKLSDGMCGFKFFKHKTAMDLINTGITTDGWFFSTEMLTKALWLNRKVKEIPIHWTDDPNSKVNVKKLSKEYFNEILRLRSEKRDFLKKYFV